MAKVNMFDADRVMVDRVAKFVDLKVLRAEYVETTRQSISALKKLIDNLDNLKGSVFENDIESKRAQYESDVEVQENALKEKLDAMEKFEYTDADKTFKKSLRGLSVNDTKEIKEAIRVFFKSYNLEVKDTDFEKSLLNAIGGKVSMKKFVKTEGSDGVVINENNALIMLYWITFNYCVIAGTCKAQNIPEILKNKYIKDNKVNKEAAKEVVEK